ncbi:MAG: zinc ABC transporter substrate-binding protein [Pseudomonadota bacterium]
MKTTTSAQMLRKAVLLFVFIGVMLLGAQKVQAAFEVFVSIPPQKWLSDRIGGQHLSTGLLIPKGQDPHTFEPTPKQVGALGHSQLYFTVGLEFEEQIIRKIRQSSSKLQIVDCTAGIEKLAMAEHHKHGEESAHHEDGHGHEGLDPHVWLSPLNLKIMAAEMAKAIIAADPQNSGDYTANLEQLSRELDELDRKIAAQLQPYSGATFFVFHPSFGYFAKRYGLHQEAVEVEGKSPTPKQLSNLIAEARAEGVKVLFVQPQFDSRSGEMVAAAIGGEVVPLDSLAEDVKGNLETIASKISTALAQ